MLKRVHPIAGMIGFLAILTFWTSTVLSELSGSAPAVSEVKQAIPWGFLILAPALAVAGASGSRMAGASKDPGILRKKRRMPFIAANGVLILIMTAAKDCARVTTAIANGSIRTSIPLSILFRKRQNTSMSTKSTPEIPATAAKMSLANARAKSRHW